MLHLGDAPLDSAKIVWQKAQLLRTIARVESPNIKVPRVHGERRGHAELGRPAEQDLVVVRQRLAGVQQANLVQPFFWNTKRLLKVERFGS